MTIQSRATLKAKFEDGDVPTGDDYANLIDSAVNLADTSAQALSSELSATKLVTPDLSAASSYVGDVSADTARIAGTLYVSGITSVGTIYADAVIQAGQVAAVPAYCQIYEVATASTGFSAASAWQRALATTSAPPGVAVNVSQAATDAFVLQIDAAASAIYQVNCQFSMTAGANSKTYQFGFAKNETPIPQGRVQRKIGTGADVGAAGCVAMLSMTCGDTIELIVRNLTDTTDLHIEDGTFTVIAI